MNSKNVSKTTWFRGIFAYAGLCEELSTAQIMERLDLSHMPTLRKNYLNPALAQGVIEMTIPDKPNSRNRTLFFHLFSQHVQELMPIVYDPGIAESIRNYSEFFMTPQNAAYLTADHPEEMEEAIRNAAGDRDWGLA